MNTINTVTQESIEMIDDGVLSGGSDDDDQDEPSSPESAYDGCQDLMNVAMEDEVTAQLAAAGPVGVAAAAAIASAKKRKRPHSFETNPSVRKRQQNRLLRKLRQTIYEFATRVGQQAIVLVATPGKTNTSYKVFGAKPLEDVVKNVKSIVMEELELALAQQAPPPPQEDPSLFELPPLIIDGIPTPVEKMTQAQLRAFIPLMLKYSTGRGKPGWGRESTRPAWWPKELPWANVRMDARTEDQKQKISWTHALRKIVINCYKYHGREDLLPAFCEEDEKANQLAAANSSVQSTHTQSSNVGVLKIHSSGVVSGGGSNNSTNIQIQSPSQQITNAQYTQVLSTITNADGSVSILQVDPNNPIITLPDGTTAQVQGVATLHTTQGEGGTTVHAVQGIDANGQTENMTVDLTDATLGSDGQIIITGEDGHSYPITVNGMITVPVSASMYQTMIANIQQLQDTDQHPHHLICTPMQVQNNHNNNNNNHNHVTTTTTQSTITTTIPTITTTTSTTNNNIHCSQTVRLVHAIKSGSRFSNNNNNNNNLINNNNNNNNNNIKTINENHKIIQHHHHNQNVPEHHPRATMDPRGNVIIHLSTTASQQQSHSISLQKKTKTEIKQEFDAIIS